MLYLNHYKILNLIHILLADHKHVNDHIMKIDSHRCKANFLKYLMTILNHSLLIQVQLNLYLF